MDLHLFWFITLGILLAGYAVLDGFDLGVGILLPFVKSEEEKKVFLNSIGPVWDGNEVWLITFGGALFAAFPDVYATVFSGFYIAMMSVLFALILRAVSIEFRGKINSPRWSRFWDFGFFLGSFLATFLFGVAIGAIIAGIPVGPDKEFSGGIFDIVHPFSLLTGIFAVTIFVLHGLLYLILKTEDKLQQTLISWGKIAFALYATLYIATTVLALVFIPTAKTNFIHYPLGWIIAAVTALAVSCLSWTILAKRHLLSFIFSSCAISGLIAIFGIAIFPNLVISSTNINWSLNIYTAASSEKTLRIMQTIAFIGMPFVLAYTAIIYRVFRGKVKLGKFSY